MKSSDVNAVGEEDIPLLTDRVLQSDELHDEAEQSWQIDQADRETLIAELQTRLAAGAFDLTDKLMRDAFAEMEAKIYKHISASLRQELPELIDTIIREQLAKEQED